MGTALKRRTTAEKLRLFRRFFAGLKNVYGRTILRQDESIRSGNL